MTYRCRKCGCSLLVNEILYTSKGQFCITCEDKYMELRDLDRIAFEIGEDLARWGVTVLQTKEKFGQVRVYVYFSRGSVVSSWQYYHYQRVYKKFLRRYPRYDKAIREGASVEI